jgi:hypothetical protein
MVSCPHGAILLEATSSQNLWENGVKGEHKGCCYWAWYEFTFLQISSKNCNFDSNYCLIKL